MNNVNSIESLEEKGYKRRKVDGVDYMVKPYHVPRHILKIEGDKAVRIMGEVREKVLRVLDNRDDRVLETIGNDAKLEGLEMVRDRLPSMMMDGFRVNACP